VDLIKPNAQELEQTLGVRLKDVDSLKSACRELINRGARMVLLSLGEEGAVITDGDTYYHCKSINVAVNSTVGAGDAMVAAVATRIRKGSPLPELLRAGVAAGTARISTIEKVSFSRAKSEEIFKKLKVTEF
jgi:1-phosphofructokinase